MGKEAVNTAVQNVLTIKRALIDVKKYFTHLEEAKKMLKQFEGHEMKESLVVPLARLDKFINVAEMHNNELTKRVTAWVKMVETAEQYSRDAVEWEKKNKAIKRQIKDESGSELEHEVEDLDAGNSQPAFPVAENATNATKAKEVVLKPIRSRLPAQRVVESPRRNVEGGFAERRRPR